jgi:hypothetical protein
MTDSLKLPVSSLKLQITSADYAILNKGKNAGTTNILGQERAQSALAFGVAMQNPGYNIYVMGEPGTGRLSMITNHLTPISQTQETAPFLCLCREL